MTGHLMGYSAPLLALAPGLSSAACRPVNTASSGTVGIGASVPITERAEKIANTFPPEVREKGRLNVVMTVGIAPLNASDSSTGEALPSIHRSG